MLKDSPIDPQTQELVKQFCNHVFQVKLTHNIYKELYEDEHAKYLMEKTAHHFFYDIGNVLINYLFLEISKLSDPATASNKRENFTIANLVETIAWPDEILTRIEQLNEKVKTFRAYIKDARNWLIAHYDKETVIAGAPIGGFPAGADSEVVQTLEEIANIFHEGAFGEILGDMVPSHPGDVLDLKKALTMAVAFKYDLMRSTSDAIRFDELMRKVGSEEV